MRPASLKPSEPVAVGWAYNRQQPVETITVEGADAAAVQKEAEKVAVALDGRMLPGQTAAQNFQVEVPRRNVLAFKSQLAQIPTRQQQVALLRSRSDRTGVVAGAVTADALRAADGREVAKVASLGGFKTNAAGQAGEQLSFDKEAAAKLKDEGASPTVLEIQVVPPKR